MVESLSTCWKCSYEFNRRCSFTHIYSSEKWEPQNIMFNCAILQNWLGYDSADLVESSSNSEVCSFN